MYVFFLWLALLVSGCATLVDGPKQELSFQANPEEVSITLLPAPPPAELPIEPRPDGWTPPRALAATPVKARVLGTTPLRITLNREVGQSIVFSKVGYKPLTMQLATR